MTSRDNYYENPSWAFNTAKTNTHRHD